MAITNTGDNKFGPSPYVVDHVLGNGANFNTIQSAIDQAFADGGGDILIHSSTGVPYVENLTLMPNVFLTGCTVDGRLPVQIVINGNHTFSLPMGTNYCLAQNISFQAAAGDVFTVSPGADQTILAMKFCDVTAMAGNCVVVGGGGGNAFFSCSDCNLNASVHIVQGLAGGGSQITISNLNANSDAISANSSGHALQYATVSAGANCINLGGTASIDVRFCSLSATDSTLKLAAACNAFVTHTTHASNAAGGFYINGNGTYTYCNDVLQGPAIDFAGTITSVPYKWRPYAESGAGPAPSIATVRGTSCFDSASFTVTDGFVQLIGVPGGFTWTDQGVDVTVTSFSGSFVTAAITLTLPAAPVQGDSIAFKSDFAGGMILQTSGTQKIRMAGDITSAGGFAKSYLQGDAVELTYRMASDTWIANSIIGGWDLF